MQCLKQRDKKMNKVERHFKDNKLTIVMQRLASSLMTHLYLLAETVAQIWKWKFTLNPTLYFNGSDKKHSIEF